MGIALAHDRCIHVNDAVWALFHLVDDNCNAVRDLVVQHPKRFLADQLRCDLAHRLVGDGILIVKLRTCREIFKNTALDILNIHLFESRNRDNLRKIQNILICRDKGQNLFLRFDRINFINNQNDRRLDLRKLLCNVTLACPDEGGRLYQPENHVNLF